MPPCHGVRDGERPRAGIRDIFDERCPKTPAPGQVEKDLARSPPFLRGAESASLGALAMRFFYLRWRGWRAFSFEFDNRQVKLPARRIDADDADGGGIADADAPAGALAADDAAGFVDVPPVVHQIFVADQSIDEPGGELHEDAEIGDAGDDAGEIVRRPCFPEDSRILTCRSSRSASSARRSVKLKCLPSVDQVIVAGNIFQMHFAFFRPPGRCSLKY